MGSARTLIAIASLFAAAAPAAAHTFATPKRDAVRVEPDGVEVTIEYLVSPGEAAELRRLWDFDHDGRIRGRERDAACAWLVLAASHFLEVSVDGTRLPLAEDLAQRAIEGVDDPASSSAEIRVVLVFAGKATFARGPHRLSIADRHKDASIPVPVKVALVGGLVTAEGAPTEGLIESPRAALAVSFRAP